MQGSAVAVPTFISCDSSVSPADWGKHKTKANKQTSSASRQLLLLDACIRRCVMPSKFQTSGDSCVLLLIFILWHIITTVCCCCYEPLGNKTGNCCGESQEATTLLNMKADVQGTGRNYQSRLKAGSNVARLPCQHLPVLTGMGSAAPAGHALHLLMSTENS